MGGHSLVLQCRFVYFLSAVHVVHSRKSSIVNLVRHLPDFSTIAVLFDSQKPIDLFLSPIRSFVVAPSIYALINIDTESK